MNKLPAHRSPSIRLLRSGTTRAVAGILRAVILLAAFGMSHQANAAELTTVRLKSGRTFTGAIDGRTDEKQLWLRFGDESLRILRPIEWASVAEAWQGERALTSDQLRTESVREQAEIVVIGAVATVAKTQADVPAARSNRTPGEARGGLHPWHVEGDAVSIAQRRPRIQAIEADAYLANWDADVESDGLIVSVSAIDEIGNTSPVNGTLDVELLGERFSPLTRGNAVPIYGRWTEQVRAADPDAGHYRRRLEFQALHPEYHLWLSRYALVHVRLTIPGEGTFEASIDGVALRGFTPVRDRTQQAFGTRFLPTEAAGRGHRPSAGYVP